MQSLYDAAVNKFYLTLKSLRFLCPLIDSGVYKASRGKVVSLFSSYLYLVVGLGSVLLTGITQI